VKARFGVATAIALCGLVAGSGAGPVRADLRVSAERARTPPPRFRYIYNSDSAAAAAAAAANGWNLIDVGSKAAADVLPRGTRGLVWVGDYDNSSCSWEISDSTVTSEVQRMVGDPKIFGYFISDEPNPYACPNAPAHHKARSDLIHSIDPTKPTVIVLDSNGFTSMGSQDAIDQIPLWKGTASYIGLDPYVCYSWSSTCDYARIDANIAAANRAHIRYWGVVQAFDDGSWRWPTAAEARRMLRQWSRSRESGYMTFAWRWAGQSLVTRPGLLAVLRRFNRGAVPRRAATRKVAASAADVRSQRRGQHALDSAEATLQGVFRVPVARWPLPSA